jgi:hypothetical protein
MIYRMQVDEPTKYANAYSKLIKAQEEAGNIEGTYGLRQHVSGSVNYYTHYAYTSAGSVADAMESSDAAKAKTQETGNEAKEYCVQYADAACTMHVGYALACDELAAGTSVY